ncbi:hypothetical protein [Aeromonas veronii]|uniref:hypothetical protein n=1 Tax=Aeromonas veronii TaxID=654 RepID=UPI003A33A763
MIPMQDYVYFAYLDILGYKESLSRDKKLSALDFKDKLIEASNIFNTINTAQYHHREISDSIFIHSSSANLIDFLSTIKSIFNHYLRCNLLLRGGISYGRHFENTSITYSLALTDAYLLESQHAVFPRILIQDSVIDAVTNKASNGDQAPLNALVSSKLVCKDGDFYILNTIDDHVWDMYYDTTRNIYIRDESIINSSTNLRYKYVWLHDYIFMNKPKGKRKKEFIEKMVAFK